MSAYLESFEFCSDILLIHFLKFYFASRRTFIPGTSIPLLSTSNPLLVSYFVKNFILPSYEMEIRLVQIVMLPFLYLNSEVYCK